MFSLTFLTIYKEQASLYHVRSAEILKLLADAQKLDDLNNRLDHIILRCLSDQERKIANLDDRLERGYINRKLLIEQKRQKVIAIVLALIVTLGFIVWILMK